jgi:transmembrane sensor
MTNIVPLPNSARRHDEASRWIARLDRELTPDEEDALRAWLSDPDNEALLLDMAALWERMESLSRLSHLFPKPVTSTSRWRRKSLTLAAASTLGAVLAVLGGLWLWQSNGLVDGSHPALVGDAADAEHLYETAIGERSTVTLPDGTRLTLNTASRVRVSYSSSHRLLALLQGEIYIEVAKDELRPLSVLANDRIVQAVGTEFNLRITPEQKIELLVTEGRVRVAVNAPQAEGRTPTAPGELPITSLEVTAGQRLTVDNHELHSPLAETVELIPSEEIEVRLSWQQGNLIFRGEPLEEALREIGRYTSVEFVILGDDLKQVRVAGLFRAGDVESLLTVLKENFDIVYEHAEDQKIILSSE